MAFQNVDIAVERDRQRLAGRRAYAERLLHLAEHLPPDERALVEAVYRDGRSTAELARLAGVPVRHFQRKLNKIMGRVGDPLFLFTVTRLDTLPPEIRPVARRAVLHGRTQRDTAHATGQSLHQVRKALERLRGMCDAATSLPHRPSVQ